MFGPYASYFRLIDTAITTIQAGGIVCFPTEATYGLAVDIANHEALARLAALKGRDAQAPFALIVPDIVSARSVARTWPEAADRLAKQYWPGPLTIVAPAAVGTSRYLVGPTGGVGMRVSSHPIANQLAQCVGPITATSANPSGQPPANTIKIAKDYFGDAVDLYLDAGVADAQYSTIVEAREDDTVAILRQGAIVLDETCPDRA